METIYKNTVADWPVLCFSHSDKLSRMEEKEGASRIMADDTRPDPPPTVQPLTRKAPPHLSRLKPSFKVSSPSDNLSPCSQRLVSGRAADLSKGYPLSMLVQVSSFTGRSRGHSRVCWWGVATWRVVRRRPKRI